MSCKEVITLQIGHYSNFVGTHWWNNQESSFCYNQDVNSELLEIDHDVLFREGQNPRGEVTYTPRLIAVDLKSNLKTLKKDGILYNTPHVRSSLPLWQGKLTTFKSDNVKKNEFLQDLFTQEEALYPDTPLDIDEDRDICQAESSTTSKDFGTVQNVENKFYNLDDSVTVWSDFLRIHHHPRSLCLIENFHQQDEFDEYSCGLQLYNKENIHEMIEDSVRYFAEECDFLKGFHILLDGHDGFTAIANGVLQHLEDSYSSKARLCFPLYSPKYVLWKNKKVKSSEISQYYSSIMGYDTVATYSNLFSPLDANGNLKSENYDLNFPYLTYNFELPYHTSAILSLALDTITLPTRLKKDALQLSEVINGLAILGRKLALSSLCAPIPVQEHSYLQDALNNGHCVKLIPLTPCCSFDQFDAISQYVTFRGIPEAKLYKKSTLQDTKTSVEKILGLFLKSNYPSSLNFYKIIKAPCKTTTPFPHIFSPEITIKGYLGKTKRPINKGVENISSIAGLHSSNNAAESVNLLLQMVDKTKLQRYSSCKNTGIESDDFLDAVENLRSLAECYKDS